MTNKLPPWYIEGIPRVSDIVSFVHPFKGTDWEKRYKDWLQKIWVDENLYLAKAQEVGTYVHQWMEDYINDVKPVRNESIHTEVVDYTIRNGIEYIDELYAIYGEERDFVAEPVLQDEEGRYQWSSDLVLIHKTKKKVIIIDWKSFGISKSFFIDKTTKRPPPNKYSKPYPKIKKGQLQFSLYGNTYIQKGYEVEKLILVYLHTDKAYAYEMEQMSSDELDTILTAFAEEKQRNEVLSIKQLTMPTINQPLDVEILLPTENYGNIKVRLDLSKTDNWFSEAENIDALIKKAKYIKQEVMKG